MIYFSYLPCCLYSKFLPSIAGRFIYSSTVVTGEFSFPPGKYPVLFLSKERATPPSHSKQSRELETCHVGLSHQFNFTSDNKGGQYPILEVVACILKLLTFQTLSLQQYDEEL